MTLKLTEDALRRMWPRAPSAIIQAFLTQQDVLARAGILDNPQRLAFFAANLAHESGDWTIPGLTENIYYSASRMAKVWPNRFASPHVVIAKYGTDAGWQLRAFDDIYGNRMGNRPGTRDGSTFIGRGGPQITGRQGYQIVGQLAGLDLENNPRLACLPEHQPAISAAFWTWKKMNAPADADDFDTCVVRWNGGRNGMADRREKLARILPVAVTLGSSVVRSPKTPATQGHPASPRTPKAPKSAPKVPEATAGWAAFLAAVGTVSYVIGVALPYVIGAVALGIAGFVIWKHINRKKNTQ